MVLEHQRHFALARREAVQHRPTGLDLATRRRHQTGDRTEQRRFTAARRARQYDELASLCLEINIAQDRAPAEFDMQPPKAQSGCRTHGCSPAGCGLSRSPAAASIRDTSR